MILIDNQHGSDKKIVLRSLSRYIYYEATLSPTVAQLGPLLLTVIRSTDLIVHRPVHQSDANQQMARISCAIYENNCRIYHFIATS